MTRRSTLRNSSAVARRAWSRLTPSPPETWSKRALKRPLNRQKGLCDAEWHAHPFFVAGGGGWSGERSKCHGRWPQDVMGTRSSRASPSASMARRKLAKERGKAFSKELGCGRASPRRYSDGACQKFRGEGPWTYPVRLDARQQSPPFRTRTPRRGPRSGRRQDSLAPCAAT